MEYDELDCAEFELNEDYFNLIEELNRCELSPLEEYTINKFCEFLESGRLQESSIKEQTFRVFNTNERKFEEFLLWTGRHNILEEVVPAEYKNELRLFEGIGKFFGTSDMPCSVKSAFASAFRVHSLSSASASGSVSGQ